MSGCGPERQILHRNRMSAFEMPAQPVHFILDGKTECIQWFPEREPIVGVRTSPSKQVVRQLNERPHKALGIETPAERSNASVASTG